MPTSPPITIAIARCDDLLALGLHGLVESDTSLTIVADDVAIDRFEVVLHELCPRVLILDISALRNPLQMRELSAEHPATKLVVLANRPSMAECAQLLAPGATSCLGHDAQARDVLHAIHLSSRGLQVMPRTGPHPGDTATRSELLTQREAEVVALLEQGRSNTQIAMALQVGVETIRTHARSIYRKLGVSSRRALSAPAKPARKHDAGSIVHSKPRRVPPTPVTRHLRSL